MATHEAHSPSSLRKCNAPLQPYILDELIVEILSWLPVISLLRFKCVCKYWNSLISSPSFVKLHLQKSSRNPRLLLLLLREPRFFEWSFVSYSERSFLDNPSFAIAEDDLFQLNQHFILRYLNIRGFVIGSCNGLVCLRRCDSSLSSLLRPVIWFSLLNPVTNFRFEKFATLSFPPSGSLIFTTYAFGYDILSDTYKVVVLLLIKAYPLEIRVKVCNFGEKCWRNIDFFPVAPFFPYYGSKQKPHDVVYFNGTLNLLAFCDVNYFPDVWDKNITVAQMVIVSLNLGVETWSQFFLPRIDEALQIQPTVRLLMNCLCFCHDYKSTHFMVWKMKEFGDDKSWTMFLKVSYQDFQIDSLDYSWPLLPLYMSDAILITVMKINEELQAIIYNQRDSSIKRIELAEEVFWSYTKDYVESLVTPCCKFATSASSTSCTIDDK